MLVLLPLWRARLARIGSAAVLLYGTAQIVEGFVVGCGANALGELARGFWAEAAAAVRWIQDAEVVQPRPGELPRQTEELHRAILEAARSAGRAWGGGTDAF